MPVGSINSSADAVGVAVVNYAVPVCESTEDVLANCRNIAATMVGIKRGYPGVDLIVFPEYSTQGFHPTKWAEFTTTLDGPEVAILAEACVANGVWGIFSITGEQHPEGKNPYNTLIMINDKGEIALTYRKIFPWVPKEPWTAGHHTAVAEGPKGLMIGALICYDANLPEVVRDTVMKGAELVVRIQGYMHPSREQQRMVAQIRAWENNTYFCVANMAGRDLVYSYFGHSCIIDFDGRVLAECGPSPMEVTYATLPMGALRDARRNWTAENHIYNLMHRGYTSEPGGCSRCPLDFYKAWVKGDGEEARELSEQLTRNHDLPEKASTPQALPVAPPQSPMVLKAKKIGTMAEAASGGIVPATSASAAAADGHANGHANGNGVAH